MNPVLDPPRRSRRIIPFFSTASAKNRLIWALGLRNPFTFNIQPRHRVSPFVNDVGRRRHGRRSTTRGPVATSDGRQRKDRSAARHFPSSRIRYTAYRHSGGTPTGCAITGGAFYTRWLRRFRLRTWEVFLRRLLLRLDLLHRSGSPATATPFAAASAPVDLKVGSDGASTTLHGERAASAGSCPAEAAFPGSRNSRPIERCRPARPRHLRFRIWNGTALVSVAENGVDIPTATTASYTTLPTVLADTGSTYRCRVAVRPIDDGDAATLTVLDDLAPTATIPRQR